MFNVVNMSPFVFLYLNAVQIKWKCCNCVKQSSCCYWMSFIDFLPTYTGHSISDFFECN